MPNPSASSGSPRAFDDAQGRPERVEGRAESSGDWKPHIRPRLAALHLSPSYGPADVTGTVKSDEVVLSVTVNVRDSPQTASFSGKVSSATKMSGTVTGTSDQPRKWSAERKAEGAGTLAIVNQYGGEPHIPGGC